MKKIKTTLGEEIDNALEALDCLLEDRTLTFLSGLWDGTRGGFYRSAYERDRRGCFPDVDSTAQVISLLSSGAIKGAKGKLGVLLPEELRKKILGFTDAFSETDRAKYKSIREKLGAESDGKPDAPRKSEGLSTKEHFKSKETFIEHLNGTRGTAALKKLRDELSDIKKAGLCEALFDYLDSSLVSEYGYKDLSELCALVSIYNEEKRLIKNAGDILDGLISLGSSCDEPQALANLYSFWQGLYGVIKNISEECESRSDERGKKALYSSVRAKAPELIDSAHRYLLRFKADDGGFAYYITASREAFGADGGDVNSTVKALHGVRGNIFACLGLTTPPLFEETALDAFVVSLTSAKRVRKRFFIFKR